MAQQQSGNRNELLVPQSEQRLELLKWEIATELGIQLGADQTSRLNGSVGGEMVRRMIMMAEQQLSGRI
ncbi:MULTISPECIES: alpha/beta-type small acid-soluble spore protein [Aneurinibacillus]|jgi:small acid-soluble spore protein A (major alpha-type SASP)|uniref:Acid-soluble spore protein n=1 Tax=Aneurinibacillus danicus TaxID=267746 RepID=A0A511VD37_9BACL|nr:MULTISPECIES: alpha/beta-type small acid-soluble spore protein [Aneurinibacillus]GEN36807.1 acid-soluble spore protein [Aneurinibacillus danicus]